MERRKAIWASTAVAASLVATSMAYAATSLLSPAAADHVGELKATVERPVQYVYDEVPGLPPAGASDAGGVVSGQILVDPAGAPLTVADDHGRGDDDEASDADDSKPTAVTAPEQPTTTFRYDDDDDEYEDHSSEDDSSEDEHEDDHEDSSGHDLDDD